MTKSIYDVNWLDLIPPSILGDPQVQAISAAVTPQLQGVSNAITECIILARLNELPEDVVDLLSWQYHVDYYGPPTLSIEQKRNLVRRSIATHRYKGTPYAVESVIQDIYSDASVEEWWEYAGEPYHFRVNASVDVNVEEIYPVPILIRIINAVKNVRSWLDKVQLHWVIRDYKVPFEQIVQLQSTSRFATRFWNKDATKDYRWDGVYRFDGTIDFSAEGMTLNQQHDVRIYQIIKAVTSPSNELTQLFNGTFKFDGTRLFGNFTPDGPLCHNSVKIKVVKNEIEQGVTQE